MSVNHDDIRIRFRQHVKPPAVIDFYGRSRSPVIPLPEDNTQCPETHFQCPDDGYCLPVYVRCNSINDCPGHEDEAGCESYTCPGFYRCWGSKKTICMHVNHLCDGYPQCPQNDDELACDMTCPEQCSCSGLAFICTRTFHVSSFPQMRYLEIKRSNVYQHDLMDSCMLIYLSVLACGWSNLTDFTLSNLRSLDLSDNKLTHVNFSHFKQMRFLHTLSLAGNPLASSLSSSQPKVLLPSLLALNLSRIHMHRFDMSILSSVLPNLEFLDVSQCRIKSLEGQDIFLRLQVLDLQDNPVHDFNPNFMKRMKLLTRVFASSFRFCCSVVLPLSFQGECVTRPDEISSCNDLLKSDIFQYTVTVIGLLAVLGNACSIIFRLYLSPKRIKTSTSVFVLNLSFSDFLMGVYVAFIGMADRIYGGVYVWKESEWKRSEVCSVAGFLSYLSSEVSAFLIFLITLDQFLVLRCSFSQIRFGATSAHIASSTIWFLGFILAVIPLLPVTSHWEYYQQTGICIPLPVTSSDFTGHSYSLTVMIFCRLILCLLITVGQSLTFVAVCSIFMSEHSKIFKNRSDRSTRCKEFIIARRFLSITMSAVLCWFPISLCGLLAHTSIFISDEVNAAMAIVMLPLSSALHPFIYTLNVMFDQQRKE